MAIIYSYPRATPKADDLIIGTVVYDEDAANPVEGMPTRTFTVADVAEFASKYTLTSAANGVNANIILTSSTGVINNVGLIKGAGISITDDGSNNITLQNTGVLSITATNSTFINNSPTNTYTGDVVISSALSATGTPGATNYLRGDNVWYTPVTLLGTQDTTFINLTPNVATNGDVTVSALLSATGTPTSEKYLRGDNSWSTPVTSITTSDTTYIDLTPNTGSVGTVDITASLSATGPASNTTFLRGDNVWAIPYAVNSVSSGVGINVDNADPINPVINNTGVLKILAGNDIEITPIDGTGNVTINSTSQGGVTSLIAGDNIVLNPTSGLGDVTVNAPNLIAYSEVSTVNMDFVSDDTSLGGGTPSDTVLSTQLAIKTYVDNAVVGGLVYQGGYDATTNSPILDNRGTQIAVEKGWTYTVTANGTFYGETVKVGDVLIAEQDLAAGTGSLADWTTVQSNIDLATAGTTGTAVRGLAGFDSADFTVADGFVELGSTTVTAGSYTNADITVDENGRITSAASGYVPSDVAVLNEGAELTPTVQSIDFTGTGVVATTVGNAVTVDITQSTSSNTIILEARNQTGATMPAGSVVYISGGDSSGNVLYIALASASSEAGSSKTLGITAEVIANNSSGTVVLEGFVEGLDTDGLSAGQTLWLSDTPGQWQGSPPPPTPSHAVFVGYASRIQQNNGSIFVKIQNGYELEELHDVLITDVTEGQIIAWDNANGYWKNIAPPPGTTSLVQNDFVGTGSQVDFTLSIAPRSTTYTSVYISGAYQEKSTYSVSGTTLTFTEAPLNGDTIEVMIITDLAVGDTVNGTGTANYVTKWIDGDTIGNSVIYNDGANVGIGTASPSSILDIQGGTAQIIRIGNTGGVNGYQLKSNVSSSADFGFLIEDYAGIDLYKAQAGAGGSHHFYINGSEKMRIDSSGNVGIGESTPEALLHISDSVNPPVLRLDYDKEIATWAAGETITELQSFIGDSSGIGKRVVTNIKAINENSGSTAAASLAFFTSTVNSNVTERMRINSSGNVGIGTTNPLTPLEVNVSGTSDVIRFTRDAGANGVLTLDFSGANANFDSEDGGYNFETASAANALNISPTGNVGIGTSSPDKILTLSASDCQIRLYDSDGTNQFAALQSDSGAARITSRNGNSSGAIVFQGFDGTVVSERMRIDGSGNVGIGETNPTEKLQIYEAGLSSYKTYTSTDAGAILTSYQSQGSPFTKTTDLVAGSDGTVPSEIRLLTRASGSSTVTERMRINSAGDINIYNGIISGTAYSTSAVVAATNLDFKSAQVFTKTITGNTTFTFSNTQIGMVKDFVLTGGGAATLSWPAGTKLAAGEYDGSVSNLIQILVVGAGDYWLTISQPQ